eukprot:SAG11_NODE_193_length_12862_cov_7.128888_16_plen_53_part_00
MGHACENDHHLELEHIETRAGTPIGLEALNLDLLQVADVEENETAYKKRVTC